jgi:hypothetical protein
VKPPLPKAVRVVLLACAALLVPCAVGLILTDGSPWALLGMMPMFFMAGYVARDIDVR